MRATFARGAAVGMVLAALTLTGTAAYAGSGVAGVVNLGTTNTVNSSTVLQGTTDNQQLRVVDSSAGKSAFGIGIHTDPSRPPLAVNSHVKVTNLNADLLDGVDSGALQRRITGRCPNETGISQIDASGSVSCATNAIVPIHEDILSGTRAVDRFPPAGVSVSTDCHPGPGPTPASFTFHAGANTPGTLNWMFSLGGATSKVDASGVALGEGSDFPLTADTTNRIEGQFIWAEAHTVITFTLHFLDLSGRCQLFGTAEVAAT